MGDRRSHGGGPSATVSVLLVGPVFFWFPPMWLATIAAGAVIVKAAQGVVAARRLHPKEAAAAS